MPREEIKKYVEKYSLGVVDIENSLDSYNSFFHNMGFKENIEDLIGEKLRTKVFVRVLDIGCGNGGFLSGLKKLYDEGMHTIGLDLLAPEKAPDQAVLGDALDVEFPKEIDFIFSFRSLHEIGEPEQIIKKIYASLAAGGKAFLSFRAIDLYTGDLVGEMKKKDLKALQDMVRSRKFESFVVNGFEVSVKDEKGKNVTAGVNVFLEK